MEAVAAGDAGEPREAALGKATGRPLGSGRAGEAASQGGGGQHDAAGDPSQPLRPLRPATTNQTKKKGTEGDSMDWNDENIALVCKLFAQQVLRGNRPNTHLNSVGYDEVIKMFKQVTGIELTRRQLKNKWDKLNPDYTAWQKLMRRQTGTGFDHAKGVIVMDDEWWKKAKKDIPGCGKFRKKPLQNLEELKVMFSDIISDESDHWNPMSQNPVIPEETQGDCGDDNEEIEESHMAEGNDFVPLTENNDAAGDEVVEISPSMGNAKRRARVVLDKVRKQKTKTALVIQEQITKIADSASSFTSKKSSEVTVQQIMDLVLDIGADYGTDEHYIATELFVKKDQRDMFLILPTKEIRFNWLTRKYHAKYGN
ncbi:L10-interacting MYB domain-containing protein-like [Panicum miliaceum]|uniref:L10-interacting MYB domain-containing protein-like n=1 Tax=Panicum miliaceum TaxID=4540 RepID=A0A3L6Q169_PANMI|nr:L10-interacting MYB domain-containing protein-like [Panicum miliaceum]